MIEKTARVLRHQRRPIVIRRIELGTAPVPAIVECDDVASCRRQCLDPTGVDPIGRHVRGEPVDEEYWIAHPLVDIGDLDTIGIERVHQHWSP